MNKTVFRTDIGGLRAIAVISVVLFHFGVTGFSGGFVGVDIFFVISGFLMTGIVARGLDNKNFSFVNFYLARARRIVPALFFLTIVLLCNPPSKPQRLFVENSININSRSFLCVNQNSLRARLCQFSNKMRLEFQSLSYAVSMVLAQLRSTSGAQNMAAWTLRS